jgi:hypothetical protein
MTDRDAGPFSSASKTGRTVHLSWDPDPGTGSYFVVEAEGLLVLFPERKQQSASAPDPPPPSSRGAIDHNAQLQDAFAALKSRVPPSPWSHSIEPRTYLNAGFRSLQAQQAVAEDIATYLKTNPSVMSAADMLFTSLAMSARADWRAVPEPHRGVAARGWFLGRWVPTFLVLDGPILRFLRSSAFKRQKGQSEFLRAIRSFFNGQDFMALRHAFAHWSFSWTVNGADSEIVATTRDSSEIRVSRREIDAFHILTFAVVEAINTTLLRPR